MNAKLAVSYNKNRAPLHISALGEKFPPIWPHRFLSDAPHHAPPARIQLMGANCPGSEAPAFIHGNSTG